MSVALAALGEEDTQRMGESAMDSIAEKFMQSNGEVDLEDEPEEAPGLAPWVHRERLFRARRKYVFFCMELLIAPRHLFLRSPAESSWR